MEREVVKRSTGWRARRFASLYAVQQRKRVSSRIVTREEIAKNDFNISPSRYIHTGGGEEYRPLVEIIEDLNLLETEVKETNDYLRALLQKLGA